MPLADENTNPKKKSEFRRFVRALFITLFTLILLAILAVYLFLNSFIKHQIEESVYRSSKGLYKVDIGTLHAKFWSGALTMQDVHLRQDTIRLKQLVKDDTTFHISKVHIKLDEVSISSIKWRNYIRNNNLKVGVINIDSPHFFMEGKITAKKTQKIQDYDQNFLDLLPGIIASFAGSLKIQELKVNSGKLKYNLKVGNGITRQTADHIDIDIFEIQIDTVSVKKALYSEDAFLHFKNYKLVTPHQHFHLSIDDVQGRISDSTLTIQNLKFNQKDSTLKNELMKLSINGIKGTGVNFSKLIQDKKIVLRKLTFDSPHVEIKDNEKPKPKNEAAAPDALPDLIPGFAKDFIDSLKIDTLLIENGSMDTDIKSKDGHIIQHAENIELLFSRIFLDTLEVNKKFEYYDNARLTVKNYSFSATGNNTKISFASVKASTHNKSILLENIRIGQIHSHGPHQRYFFTNHISSIYFSGFDFRSLVNLKKIISKKADINDMRLEIFLDEARSKTTVYTHNMPQDLMAKIKFYILLDKVNINNSYLSYSDKEPTISNPAKLTFEKVNVFVSNFTNDASRMTPKTPAIFHGTTIFMGKTPLNLNMRIPFLSKGFDCSYDGSIGKIEGKAFNDFLAFEGLEVDKGEIEPSPFNINIVNGTAQGYLTFIYHDLHVNVFDKETKELKKKKTILNNFVIKNDNPQKKKNEPEIVQVSASINKNEEGFFYFLWKVLRIGIVKTMVKDSFYKQKEYQ
jgi:hypothetical protein